MEARYQAWRSTYLRSCPQGLYCFYNGKGDNGNAITCSEAHGYAMLISALHRNQQDFDGLLSYFLAFKNPRGLMKWQQRQEHGRGVYCEEDGETSATDGDIDIATALFLAHRLFAPSPAFGPGAYAQHGNALASAILRHAIHPHLGTPLLGDWANIESAEGRRLYDSTRTSDFQLSAFLLFHRAVADGAERARWQWVLESTLSAALSQQQQSGAALLPDFLVWDSRTQRWAPPKGKHLESEHDGAMGWNACRTPWRLAHYYAAGGDARIRPLLEGMHRALKHTGTWPAVPAGLEIQHGRALRGIDYSDKAFIAPAGYLCYVLGDTKGQQEAVRAMEDEEAQYFGDCIDLVIAEQAMHVELFR